MARPTCSSGRRPPCPSPGRGRCESGCAPLALAPPTPRSAEATFRPYFPLPPDAVLGFEAAGVVDSLGPSVTGVKEGDEVAALLASLGGYAQYVLASTWTHKPSNVTWSDAAAFPASAEAAVGVLRQLHVARGETLLILGGAGSVGVIATQLAIAQGLAVISAAGPKDQDFVGELGAVPVRYGTDLIEQVHAHTPSVDAVFDAAGRGGSLSAAVELAGGPSRVITLADEHAADLGVALSAPTPDRAPDALDHTMALLASGVLRLRAQRQIPIERAPEAHALLDNGAAHEKLILTVA